MALFGKKKKEKPDPGTPTTQEIVSDEVRRIRRKKQPKVTRNDEVTQIIAPGDEGPWVDTALATHIGTREYQQDSVFVSDPLEEPGTAFGVLCDGMGGMESGEQVSGDVVALMANEIAALAENADIPAFYTDAVARANDWVLENYHRQGTQAGTTLVSAIMRKGILYWASVGDSRMYIIRGDEIARLTRDHNYALQLQQLVDDGRMSQDEADSDPKREALVSYLGAPVIDLIDISNDSFALKGGDMLLMCSDGLTKTLADEEILAVIRANGDIKEAARLLPLTAFDKNEGSQDNTSVILMRYNGTARSHTGTQNNDGTEECNHESS